MRRIIAIFFLFQYYFGIAQNIKEIKPSIETFQTNLMELSSAFEKRDYPTIHKMLIHKEVSEEMFKREVERELLDSILPIKAIMKLNQKGQFGPLVNVIKDEMAYKRYIEKANVTVENCFAYFYEINGLDILVLAEWNGVSFRFIRIKNLKALLN